MKLYICGNGFDLHHGLETSYGHYKKFLEEHHRGTLIDFEHYTKLGNTYEFCWSDIEKALEIDMTRIIEECLLESGDDPVIHVYPENYNRVDDYELDEEEVFPRDPVYSKLNRLVNFIDNFTALHFMEWLCSIDMKHSRKDPELGIDPNDKFITFNYLDSLKQIYKIPSDRILHVHGSLEELGSIEKVKKYCVRIQRSVPIRMTSEKEKEAELFSMVKNEIRGTLQFGAARDFDQEAIRISNVFRNNLEVLDLYPTFHDALYKSSKRITDNYDKVSKFISSKDDIDTVVVMGHSLNAGDYPYYSDILVKELKDKQWLFYYHDDAHIEEDKFIAKTGIKKFRLKKW